MVPMGRATPAPHARRRLTALGVALACVGSLGLAGSLSARAATDPDQQRKNRVDQQIEDSKHALEESSTDFRRAYQALNATKAKVPAAQAAATAAEAARADAEGRASQAQAELDVARANETKAEGQLAATKKRLTTSERDVADVAAQMYMQQGMGEMTVAMDAQSPSDFADRLAMTGTVLELQQAQIAQLAASRATQAAQEAHLSALRAVKVKAEADARNALQQATAARNAAAAAQAQIQALAATQQRQATALQQQVFAEKSRLTGLQTESNKLRAILVERARQARLKAERERKERERIARELAKKRKRPYKPPVDPGGGGGGGGFLQAAELNQPITSEFGMRFHPILHYWRLHTGLDFGGPCGTPIYAAGPGTIIMSGWAGGYGNRVVVDHGMVRGVNLATTYNHMTRIVKFGEHVNRGQLIGYEGTTGMSTGCHLHFETLENGNFVNPRKWL
jgi:murein DD-endopeptidase MepM/ murein hydrolase activator NlpD